MRYAFFLLIFMFAARGVEAADTKISALPAASALTGVEAFPCVQSSATKKCTVTQAVTFTYSLLSGDCTATAGGAITCTKTNAVAFSALATASTPLSIANGGTGTASPGLTAGTGITLGSTWPTQSVALTIPVAISSGGTGQTTAAAAFNALSPMTTLGDVIYGGTSGGGTRLANGTTGQFLGANTSAAPSWKTPASGGNPGWSDYSTSFFYPIFPQTASASAGSAGTASVIVCAPGIISQKMTLAGLSANITTLSVAGNFQLAIYSSSSGRPGALIASTASGSTTLSGFITAAFTGVQVGPGGAQGDASLWFCANRDNATVVFTPLTTVAPAADLTMASLGTATTANLFAANAHVTSITCTGAACNGGSSTFGTWPASLVGTTWTDQTGQRHPVMFFQPSTIP